MERARFHTLSADLSRSALMSAFDPKPPD